ncbi:MAG: DNRLRE domain-containing protein, partial [Promethearchaeota archaeon]
TATTVQVFPVNQSWNENTITWNNVPDVNMSIMCSQYFPVKGGFSYINVTTIVSNWTSEIIPNFGFYLITTINGLSFYSKEDSDEERHPTLEITVSLQKSSQPNIAGFEVTIIIFGMIGVIFILLINKRYITRINIS